MYRIIWVLFITAFIIMNAVNLPLVVSSIALYELLAIPFGCLLTAFLNDIFRMDLLERRNLGLNLIRIHSNELIFLNKWDFCLHKSIVYKHISVSRFSKYVPNFANNRGISKGQDCPSIITTSKSIRWVGDCKTPFSLQNGHTFLLNRSAEDVCDGSRMTSRIMML